MPSLFFEVNGQPREIAICDRKLDAEAPQRPKADQAQPGQIGTPIPGVVSTVAIELNQKIEKGDRLLVMMEASTLLDDQQQVLGLDVLPGFDEHLPYCSCDRRIHGTLHFHSRTQNLLEDSRSVLLGGQRWRKNAK